MFGVRECLGCLGKLGIWKGGEKGKEKKLDTTGKDLESGGNQDWDFDSWDKPAAAATPPPMIQSLDDFDGLAPKAPEKGAEEETDYFGNLQTAYVPPVQGEGSSPACSQCKRARTFLVTHTCQWAKHLFVEAHDPWRVCVCSEEEGECGAADGPRRRRSRSRLLVRRPIHPYPSHHAPSHTVT